jgi:hypothetical protein
MCEVEAKSDSALARAHAKTLSREAASRGFGLIARKAIEVGGSKSQAVRPRASR